MIVGEAELRRALRTLFDGAGMPALVELNEDGLRRAYRQRAREVHPDRARLLGRNETILAREFEALRCAYDQLRSWLAQPRRVARLHAAPVRTAPVPPRAAPRPSTRHAPPPRSATEDQLLPRRPLMLAEYLFLSGRISWQERIQAIVWQRRQRPPLGHLARRWRLLDELQVRLVLRSRRPGERFGETAVRLGLLNRYQHLALVSYQRRLQQPIGRYFVEAGRFNEAQLASLLAGHARHQQRWGTARAA